MPLKLAASATTAVPLMLKRCADVKALTRLAVVYDLPMANSAATATLVIEGLIG